MTTELTAKQNGAEIMERVLLAGDLSRLSTTDRILYYNRTCESLGLNPLTKPFDYLNLNGKTVLYARKDCTEQLRQNRGVSITRLEKERDGDLYVVTAYAKDAMGREDSDIGAVLLGQLKGEALANAMMKAVTKAKRRVTLSICGLGMLDESEIDSIPEARPVQFNDRLQRASDLPREAVKHETIDGELVHPKTVDPATGRETVIKRNEENPHFAPRTTDDDAEKARQRKVGIANLNGWLKNRGVADWAEQHGWGKAEPWRELTIHILNCLDQRGGDGKPYWNSRSDLTGLDWARVRIAQERTPAEQVLGWAQVWADSIDEQEPSDTLLTVPTVATGPRFGDD